MNKSTENPYLLQIFSLLENPYDSLEVILDEQFALEENKDYDIGDNNWIHFSGQVTNASSCLALRGEVRFVEINQCSRCLKELNRQHKEIIEEYFFFPGSDIPKDSQLVKNDAIDLFQTINDAIVLSLNPYTKCEDILDKACVIDWENNFEDLKENPFAKLTNFTKN